MGWLGKSLRVLGLKSSGDNRHKKCKEDRTRIGSDNSVVGLGSEKEQIELAIALSYSEQDQIAQQDADRQRETESKSESGDDGRHTNARLEEGNQQAKTQLEEDEQLAKIIQESLNVKKSSHQPKEDENLRPKSQFEKDEQLAKTIQESLNVKESSHLPKEDENLRPKSQFEEDEQLAKTIQESLNVEESPVQLDVDEKYRAKVQLEEDEQIAKTIQESLNAKSPPHQLKENVKQCAGDRPEEDELVARAIQESLNVESPPRKCACCNSKIERGRSLSRLDAVWHPECFKCHCCSTPITDDEFTRSKRRLYHKSCYKELRHPKCVVCKDFLPTNATGLPEYSKHPFWLQMYCPKHDADGTSKCCSCERLEPKDMKYLILDDGRRLCLECLDSAILDTHQCYPLYDEIREFLEGLQMKVEQEFPLLLVERQALNKAIKGEKNEHHHVAETRGICLSEEQTVSAVSFSKKPENGAGNRLTEMVTESCKLIGPCEVTAILILYGLPRLLTGSILAHEMMHAWLRLKGYRKLEPQVEEGICQVFAHMWLESETYSGGDTAATSSSSSSATTSKKGGQPDFEKRLGELFKKQIETDPSQIYGDGFRKANAAVLKYGRERTLDHIKLIGSFPF